MRRRSIGTIGLAIVLCLPLTSCTKEKAEAIKTAAESFRVHADDALEKTLTLYAMDTAIPADDSETQIAKLVKDLKNTPEIKAETVGDLLDGLQATAPSASQDVKTRIAALRQTYAEFASMYANLPRGSFLAGAAVQRSERVAVVLSKQMINFAQMVQQEPFKLNARIISVMRQAVDARGVSDANVKEEKLRAVAQELIRLKTDTDAANQELVVACLKAAEAGATVADLIKNYDKFTAPEIIGLVKQSITAIASLSGKDATTITNRLEAIKTKIDQDPVWSNFQVDLGAPSAPRTQN